MKRYIDLSVTVDDTTFSPPSTTMRLEITPHRRGLGFWQVSSVHYTIGKTEGAPARFFAMAD